jgi:hypothetical protein
MHQNLIIKHQNLVLRLATEDDASFILNLRRQAAHDGLINKSVPSVAEQRTWLVDYKQRESAGKEFYFVTELDQCPYGVNRIYNISENSFTPGSWVFLPNSPDLIAIKAAILTRLFGFEYLNKAECLFDVRKKNIKVLRYHSLFNPEKIGESELDLFFRISREDYRKSLPKVCRILGMSVPLNVKQYIIYETT